MEMIAISFVIGGLLLWAAVEMAKSANAESKRRKKAEQAFQHIMEHGTFEEKQLALMYKQSQQTNALIGMVALGIFLDQ